MMIDSGEFGAGAAGAAVLPAWRRSAAARSVPLWVSALWLGIVLIGLLAAPQAWAQKRVALVVGNAAYTDRPLRNPVNDAQLMQATLRELGFEVQLATNVDRRGLLGALRDFEARARGAEVALF